MVKHGMSITENFKIMNLSQYNMTPLSQHELKALNGGNIYYKFLVWAGKTYVGGEIKAGFEAGMEADCSDVCSK